MRINVDVTCRLQDGVCARDQDPFQVPGSGPDAAQVSGCELAAPAPGQRHSVPRPREDGCWLRMAARPTRAPGVLLLRCLGPRRAEGSGARYVRAHWFGHAHLVGMSKLAACMAMPRME